MGFQIHAITELSSAVSCYWQCSFLRWEWHELESWMVPLWPFYPSNGDWKTSMASPLYLHLSPGLATEHTYHSGKKCFCFPILRFVDNVLCNSHLCYRFFWGLMLALWRWREVAWLCDFVFLSGDGNCQTTVTIPQCFIHAQVTGFSHSAYGPLAKKCL